MFEHYRQICPFYHDQMMFFYRKEHGKSFVFNFQNHNQSYEKKDFQTQMF